jgi:hypothetical protein
MRVLPSMAASDGGTDRCHWQKDDANCERTHGQYHFLCFPCNPEETMRLCSTKSPPRSVGTAGACPSNGVQTPWCTESKNVMIQTIRIHLSHSSASSEILCPKEAPFCPKNNEVLFSESCAIFIGFGLFGFVLRLFRVSHYCAKLPLLDWT